MIKLRDGANASTAAVHDVSEVGRSKSRSFQESMRSTPSRVEDVVDDVVGGSDASDIVFGEAAVTLDTIGAAPVVSADAGTDAPCAVPAFEPVDVAQAGPHVGRLTVGVGVAMKCDGVGLAPGNVTSQVDVDEHVAEEVSRPLGAVQRLLDEGDEVVDPAHERPVVVGTVRPVAGSYEFEVKPIHAARIGREHALYGALGEHDLEFLPHRPVAVHPAITSFSREPRLNERLAVLPPTRGARPRANSNARRPCRG
jgi:hypothetical protein